MDLGLEGAACIVTGAGGAIGAATSAALAAEGARVLLVGRSPETLEAAAAACGDDAETLVCDVTAPGAAERVTGHCRERFGRIDVFVHCAGSTGYRPLPELAEEDLETQWEINVLALFRFLKIVAPHMAERGSGSIVSVASVSGRRPSAANVAYGATKSAQIALVRGFADTYAGDGVIVNSILPGPIDTSMWRGVNRQAAAARGADYEAFKEGLIAALPRRQVGSPEEVASVIALLASPLAANVAGSAWTVDGGWTAQIF
jgi:NAD(P)-dependent dehydrogenase (short-subunit alcohol dehydrogenase family)